MPDGFGATSPAVTGSAARAVSKCASSADNTVNASALVCW